jgi:hypothetical protein
VPLGPNLGQSFHRAHEERYGYADPSGEVELVAVRTAEIRRGPTLELRASKRRTVSGPTTVELPGATCFVPEDWLGATDENGTLILERR